MTYSQVMRLNQCYCNSAIPQVQRNKVRELWKDGKLVSLYLSHTKTQTLSLSLSLSPSLSLSHTHTHALSPSLHLNSVNPQVQRNKVRELWKDGRLVAGKGVPFQRATCTLSTAYCHRLTASLRSSWS